MGAEFDRLIVMVLCLVDDADALHDAVIPAYVIYSPGSAMRPALFNGF
jgi:hypothetical protein